MPHHTRATAYWFDPSEPFSSGLVHWCMMMLDALIFGQCLLFLKFIASHARSCIKRAWFQWHSPRPSGKMQGQDIQVVMNARTKQARLYAAAFIAATSTFDRESQGKKNKTTWSCLQQPSFVFFRDGMCPILLNSSYPLFPFIVAPTCIFNRKWE